MIPIRDENPSRTTPVVTYALIAANVAAWLMEWTLLRSGAAWVIPAYGLVPARLMADPAGEAFTIVTSMFMHGGWAHLLGNMLFLHVFGDNVEDALGHFRFIAFYLAAGLAAAAAQIAIGPFSMVPMVGASGAIAGVLGAYLVLFPRAPVIVINPIFPLWFIFGVFLVFPAWLVVGEWFLWNLLRGIGSLGTVEAATGGVAFFAHLGGFVLGLLAVRPALIGRKRREDKAQVWRNWRPPPEERRLRAGRYEGGPRRDPWLW